MANVAMISRRALVPYFLVSPGALLVGGLLLLPLGAVFVLSLHQFQMATGLSKTISLSTYNKSSGSVLMPRNRSV